MKDSKQVLGVLLSAAALTVASSPASADGDNLGVGGGSFISGLTFTLVDLDPNDGISASYWFDTGAGGIVGYTDTLARTGAAAAPAQDSALDSTTNFLNKGTVTSTQASVVAAAGVGVSGMGSSGALNAYDTSFASAVRSATQPLPGGFPYSLWITPNTQLVVTAVATTYAAVTSGCNVDPSGLCGSVHSEAVMSGRTVANGIITDVPTSSISSNAGLGDFITFGPNNLPLFDTGFGATNYGNANFSTGLLSLTFTNASAFNSSEYLQLDTLVVAQAIPEPSTYALMAMGLGALALWSRRRRVY